jgi:nucleotide-binding universal stress UspA family protein
MITINTNKILIPVDFSETAVKAMKHGAEIAKVFHSEIILLHVQKKNELLDIILPALKIDDPWVITAFIEDKLEKLADDLRTSSGLKVTSLVSVGNITDEINNIAEELKVGLIIMGTQGSDSHNQLFLGSNSYKVLTQSDIPVMTIRAKAGDDGIHNILLPIDSSEHSRQKVNSAIRVAKKFGAKLHVLGILGTDEDNYEYKLNVILPQIKKLADEEHVNCETEICHTDKRVEKTLDFAYRMKTDLIIIMSDEKDGLASFILGTYAHQLINSSRIPVMSIPPEVHPENLEEPVIGGMWQR